VRGTLRKTVVTLLLGRRKKALFDIVPLKGHLYVLDIRPYESADKLICRVKKDLARARPKSLDR
jgi:hypothetical protein